MIVLNDAQAAIVESLLTQMPNADFYKISEWERRSAGFREKTKKCEE